MPPSDTQLRLLRQLQVQVLLQRNARKILGLVHQLKALLGWMTSRASGKNKADLPHVMPGHSRPTEPWDGEGPLLG